MTDTDYKQLCKQAQTLVRQRKFAEAVERFQEAAAGDKLNPDAHEGMATAYFLMGDMQNASAEFLRVTQLDPRRGRAYINLGAVYNRLQQFDKAAAALRKAVKIERKSAQAYYNLGIAQKGLKQLSMSVSAYKEAVKLNPKMAEAHQNLGNIYLEMNNNTQATRCFNTALELRPGFDRAVLGLKRAKEAVAAAKSSFSPFGRLVDESHLKDIKVDDSKYRILDDQERFEDRQTLRQFATSARDSAQEMLEIINDDFMPALADLTRVFVQSEGSSSLIAASESYDDGRIDMNEAREKLAASMQAIDKHEKEMCV